MGQNHCTRNPDYDSAIDRSQVVVVAIGKLGQRSSIRPQGLGFTAYSRLHNANKHKTFNTEDTVLQAIFASGNLEDRTLCKIILTISVT